ncbi:hypothetical protein DEO72_LG1g507 [Vigna unguiculata]|uniref:Uncharacterized protein n=1 Tax=Vigna unguiculata TaxID=3917 RepID=A0A4D6KGJ4_VIGUN|nr:hypothetical protein DEO72_LG1g507 [Vigna unguiculata]
MGLAGFLRKLQDLYAAHKVLFTIFLCFWDSALVFFYVLSVTRHLSNVFLNSEDLSSFADASFQYVSFILQVEGFAVLGISMISLQMPLINILASTKKVDSEAELSITSLISIVTKPARSLLVTWFLVRLIKLGCIFFGILVLHQRLALIVNSICEHEHELSHVLASNVGTVILVAVGTLIFSYVATLGNLAIDISVREEISGSRALKEASQVLEGKKKVVGFVMNAVLGVISVGLFLGYLYLSTCSKVSVESRNVMMMNISSFGIYEVEFYTWILFSILNSVCKRTRGQKFQPQGSWNRILMAEEEKPPLI